ncbi:MAG TPA: S8 family serine peptidase, partial [Thermoleophilaceae bacterium]|nr:S8 family serine peptidase [Thermoleophilaceae bacterium]
MAVLGGLVTGASLAGAESPRPDTSQHLLVVPGTAQGELALARADARVVARYESFSLVEATGEDVDRLRNAGAGKRDDMRDVVLAGGQVDPAQRPSLAAKDAPDRGEALVLVQFVGPVKTEWLAKLRATGATVLGYAAQNGYIVHAAGDALDRVTELVGAYPAVRAATALRPADKVERGAAGGRVAVQTVAGAPGADARAEAANDGEKLAPDLTAVRVRTQFLELSAAEVAHLAADPAVVAIEPAGVPELHDERAAQIVAGNLSGNAPSGPGYDAWLTTEGFGAPFAFAIDVTDSGLDRGDTTTVHPDLLGRVDYAHDYTLDPDATDCGGHGTNVTSIAAGMGTAGQDAQGYRHGLGVAPYARVGASKIFRCSGAAAAVNYSQLTSEAYAAGARISNNSWGISNFGGYHVASQAYDALVRDASPGTPGNQEMVEVFSAGNDGDGKGNPADPKGDEGYGSITSPGTAKNVITVGAAESVRNSGTDGCGVTNSGADNASDIINFSGRGPTQDGRMKPDVVAPGTHITGASPQHGGYSGSGVCNASFAGSPFYSLVSGTSQAAPQVSGAAALLRDWYMRDVGTQAPSPALTKALLVNTATDLDGGDSGKGAAIPSAPNTDEGWGRVDVGAALDDTHRAYVDQDTVLDAAGQSFLHSYSVADTARPVRITLAWTDPPPATVTGNAFVNDLDLEVSAGGRTYRGNWLASGVSVPGGQPDFRNNLENVVLPAGVAGRLSVKVVAKTLGGDGVPGNGKPLDQDFALVVSNADEQASSPVLVQGAVTVDDTQDPQNGDGALEPGEYFNLHQGVRNTGTDVATGVTSTLTGGSGLTISQADSAYPDITADTEEQNSTDFQGMLSTGATCGVDATGILNVTSNEGGTQAVPVNIPTGRPGPPTTYTKTETLPIPDDNSGGVASNLFVPVSGRIKDLDVRIDSIDHSFVGDLKVELTSPDNSTTVRLIEHVGGPNNGGDDLVDTVFDDEAPAVIGSAGSAAPYTGSFRPQGDQLSRLDGKQQQGTWKLRVSDRYENDTGSLLGWSMTIRTAQCDPNVNAPETQIQAAPPSLVGSRRASFQFGSPRPNAQFQCRLDGGDFTPCSSPQEFGDLPEGDHTFEVRAYDQYGNVDGSPAIYTWTVDVTAPGPRIAAAGGSTPVVQGTAGTSAGDDGSVRVDLYSGGAASGSPSQSMVVARDGSGSFSARFDPVPAGTYTAAARQSDAAGNTGSSSPVSFTVGGAAAQPPDFAVMAMEESIADAAAGRLTALSSCEGACSRTASLTVSPRVAAKLGLPRRGSAPVRLGGGATSAGAGAVKVGLSRKVKRALKRSRGTKATLAAAAGAVSLARAVTLQPKLSPARVASRGLKLGAICSTQCTISSRLVLSASGARKLRIRSGGRSVAVGTATAGASPGTARTLTVRIARSVRR